MKVLVIDIGGTNVKALATGQAERLMFPSGPDLSPRRMVSEIKKRAAGWEFDVITIGFPGPIVQGRIITEPRNLGHGWVGFHFQKALGKPVRLINDAAMQALGSYRGGRMLFLGLGTGLGAAMMADGALEPMELAHLQYRKGRTYEDYLGLRGLRRLGKRKWRRHVNAVVMRLKAALDADYVVLGGGNVKKLDVLPPGSRLGANANAFIGGFRVWEDAKQGGRRLTSGAS